MVITILREMLFLPPKDSESTPVSRCACQPPYCNHRYYTTPRNCQHSTLPRVSESLQYPVKRLRQLLFFMPAFSSHRRTGKNLKRSGGLCNARALVITQVETNCSPCKHTSPLPTTSKHQETGTTMHAWNHSRARN